MQALLGGQRQAPLLRDGDEIPEMAKLHTPYLSGMVTSPFILAQPGVMAEEIAPWSEQGETWRRLRVTFPETIATHSREQIFYIDIDGLIRRHDYEVEIQGNNAAARYLLEPVLVEGVVLPSKFRVYPRNPDNTPAAAPLIVGVDLSEYRFE